LTKNQLKKLKERKSKLITKINDQLQGGVSNENAMDFASQWLELADIDGNGKIDLKEFKAFVGKLGQGKSDEELTEIFNKHDSD
jgi:Ca2+-binding EF-hand superfamily protein